MQPSSNRRPVGLMDKASASGAGDSRLESWAGHVMLSGPRRICQVCTGASAARVEEGVARVVLAQAVVLSVCSQAAITLSTRLDLSAT